MDSYVGVIQLLQRIHRKYLENIKRDLEGLGIHDINNMQCIMLFNIGDADLSIGELTARGIYLGSNVSYNVKKMVENGYLAQTHSRHDRRVSHIRLTEKGRKLREALIMMHQRRIDALPELAPRPEDLKAAYSVVRGLDRFWTGLLDVARRPPGFV
jgi:DNA-binding MarR family transcriptional regulator